MLVHVDTSLLVDAFTGTRRALSQVIAATAQGDVLTFSTVVLYEWRRGPRIESETAAVAELFELDALPAFGVREAERAAALYRRVKRARQRQADLAIAACAIEGGGSFWTLNPADYLDIPGLTLYRPPEPAGQ